MNIESTLSILRKERLLTDYAHHSAQFRRLTMYLLAEFSKAGVIPRLSAGELQLYTALAPFHDIGKRAVPPEIRNKHGRLTREEFEIMKTHTTQGCELLEQIPPLRQSEAFPLACDVCRHHHERWDGSGYPDHLAGRDIAPWVQVVGLADAFDALLQPRVYKPAFPLGQAFEMIVSGACGAFNPDLLACFSRNIDFIYYMAYVRTRKQQS